MTNKFKTDDNYVIEKYFENERSTLMYFENIEYDGQLEYYFQNYNVYKHNKDFNAKVLIVLSLKFNNQLKNEFSEFFINLKNVAGDKLDDETILKMTREHVKVRYKQLIDNDKQYKIINRIKKRYKLKIQDELVLSK